jgi:hypothetical protein
MRAPPHGPLTPHGVGEGELHACSTAAAAVRAPTVHSHPSVCAARGRGGLAEGGYRMRVLRVASERILLSCCERCDFPRTPGVKRGWNQRVWGG